MKIKGNNILYKQNFIRYGLFGFVTSIIAFMIIMALHIPHSFVFSAESLHRVEKAFGEFLDIAPIFFFLAAVVSLGILFAGILMKPRTFPVSNFIETFTPHILLIFFCGGGLFILIIMGSLAALFISLFMEKHIPIFLSLGFFSGSVLLLLLSLLYDKGRSMVFPGTHCNDTCNEGHDGPADHKTSTADRSLSYAEKTTTYALALVGTALIHGNEVREILSSIRTDSTVTPVIPPDIIIGAALSLVLIFMSSFFILKSFKIMRTGKHP